MDFAKGKADAHVEKIIDQAAVVAKEKVGGIIGDKKKTGGAKDHKEGGGKPATDPPAKSAGDHAKDIGKGLLK